ncbi:MAG TPA: histone [archaeon]|nr:histone [archaeon]
MTEVLPVAPFRNMLKRTGVRVSGDASEALAEIIEELGFLVIEEAREAAIKAKRKTIRKVDIETARRNLW